MIKFADSQTRLLARSVWKGVFGDRDEYLDLVFSPKLQNENILLYIEENEVVASLQMIPYSIRFYGEIIEFYYLAGLATLPSYRSRGYMGELILHSFKVMSERNIPLAILVPAEESLFFYYKRYGFEKTFGKGEKEINLKEIIETYPMDTKEAFDFFDDRYQQTDFTVLKSEFDFQCIVDDYVRGNCPPKYNLNGMSRIIDAQFLLNLYAKNNASLNFLLKLNDDILNQYSVYLIKDGVVKLVDSEYYDLEVKETLLIKLLFGYDFDDIDDSILSKYFKAHKTTINLMLE